MSGNSGIQAYVRFQAWRQSVTPGRVFVAVFCVLSMLVAFSRPSFAVVDPNQKPKEPETLLSEEISLPAGDYQWQATSLTTLGSGDHPFGTHRGLLIAVSGPVSLTINGESPVTLEQGKAQALAEGDKVLPTSQHGQSVDMVIVELVARADILPGEMPDLVAKVTLVAGGYRLTVMDMPANPAGTPVSASTPEVPASTPEATHGFVFTVAHTDARIAATPVAGQQYQRWVVSLVPLATSIPVETRTESAGTSRDVPGGAPGDLTPTTTAATLTPMETTPTVTPTATTMPTATATMAPTSSSGGSGGGIIPNGKVVVGDSPVLRNAGDVTLQFVDTDGDGLTDGQEKGYGTNPNDVDSDGDGVADGEEVNYGCNPLARDTDGDGLYDDGEIVYKTRCDVSDSDSDGLGDHDEIFAYYSDANLYDTDSDGISDYDEVIVYGTAPRYADSDGDGWNDGYEHSMTGTNPLLKDSDFDCDSDPWEVANGHDPLTYDEDNPGGFSSGCPTGNNPVR